MWIGWKQRAEETQTIWGLHLGTLSDLGIWRAVEDTGGSAGRHGCWAVVRDIADDLAELATSTALKTAALLWHATMPDMARCALAELEEAEEMKPLFFARTSESKRQNSGQCNHGRPILCWS